MKNEERNSSFCVSRLKNIFLLSNLKNVSGKKFSIVPSRSNTYWPLNQFTTDPFTHFQLRQISNVFGSKPERRPGSALV